MSERGGRKEVSECERCTFHTAFMASSGCSSAVVGGKATTKDSTCSTPNSSIAEREKGGGGGMDYDSLLLISFM